MGINGLFPQCPTVMVISIIRWRWDCWRELCDLALIYTILYLHSISWGGGSYLARALHGQPKK